MAPINARIKYAAVLPVITVGGTVYAALIWRPTNARMYAGRWHPPAGHVEANESPRACAIRELREETDLRFSDVDLVPMPMLLGREGLALFSVHTEAARLPALYGDSGATTGRWWSADELTHNVAVDPDGLVTYMAARANITRAVTKHATADAVAKAAATLVLYDDPRNRTLHSSLRDWLDEEYSK